MMKKAFSILIKAALIVIGVLGIVFTIQSAGFMGGKYLPLYYVIFYFCGVPLGVEYAAGSTAPYFFLDFGSIGWFFEKGTAGTAIWILILLVAMSLPCLLFAKCMKLRQKTKRA